MPQETSHAPIENSVVTPPTPKKHEFVKPLEPENASAEIKDLCLVGAMTGLTKANGLENISDPKKREKMLENSAQGELAFYAKLARYASGALPIGTNNPVDLSYGISFNLVQNQDNTYSIPTPGKAGEQLVRITGIKARDGNNFTCFINGTTTEINVDTSLILANQLTIAYEQAGSKAEFTPEEQKIIEGYIKVNRGDTDAMKDITPDMVQEAGKSTHQIQAESVRKYVDHIVQKPEDATAYIQELTGFDSEPLKQELAAISELTIPDEAQRNAKKAELQAKIDAIDKKEPDAVKRTSKIAELKEKIEKIDQKNSFREDLLQGLEGKTFASYQEVSKVLVEISREGLDNQIGATTENIEQIKKDLEAVSISSLGKPLAGHEQQFSQMTETLQKAESQMTLLTELKDAVEGDDNAVTEFFNEAEQGKKDPKVMQELQQSFEDGRTDRLLDAMTGKISEADKKKIKSWREKFKENAPVFSIGSLLFAFLLMKKAAESGKGQPTQG